MSAADVAGGDKTSTPGHRAAEATARCCRRDNTASTLPPSCSESATTEPPAPKSRRARLGIHGNRRTGVAMDKHEVGVPGENANTRKVDGADRATSAASTPTALVAVSASRSSFETKSSARARPTCEFLRW